MIFTRNGFKVIIDNINNKEKITKLNILDKGLLSLEKISFNKENKVLNIRFEAELKDKDGKEINEIEIRQIEEREKREQELKEAKEKEKERLEKERLKNMSTDG